MSGNVVFSAAQFCFQLMQFHLILTKDWHNLIQKAAISVYSYYMCFKFWQLTSS